VTALVQSLRELGYEDGRTARIEVRYGSNNAERLAQLAAELVRLDVSVIVTNGDLATRAVQRATATIPIVAMVGFPVESGFVQSVARPGGNITATAALPDEVAMKQLEVLKELLPAVTRVGVLNDPVVSTRIVRAAQAAAEVLKLQLQVVEARTPEQFPAAFDAMVKGRAQAVAVLISPMFTAQRQTIVDLAAGHRLPAIYERREFCDVGGLLSFGPDQTETVRAAARLVAKILKGASPATLPVEQARRFQLAINVKTARAQGLAIPPSLIQRADLVLE
jgi:putative ABC transport system substrate-binding protein